MSGRNTGNFHPFIGDKKERLAFRICVAAGAICALSVAILLLLPIFSPHKEVIGPDTERIQQIDVSFFIAPGGGLDVTEALSAYSKNEKLIFPWLSMPLSTKDADGNKIDVQYQDLKVTINDEPFTVQRSSDGRRFEFSAAANSPQLKMGDNTIVFDANTQDLVSHDKEGMNFVTWLVPVKEAPVPVQQVVISVLFPEASPENSLKAYRSSSKGPVQELTIMPVTENNRVSLTISDTVKKREDITVVARWKPPPIVVPAG